MLRRSVSLIVKPRMLITRRKKTACIAPGARPRYVRAMSRSIFLLFFLICFVTASLAQSKDEKAAYVSTYYPAPAGWYQTLKVSPNDEPAMPNSKYGQMYFNQTDNCMYVFTKRGWETVFNCGQGRAPVTKNCTVSSSCAQPMFQPTVDTRMPSLQDQCAAYCSNEGFKDSRTECSAPQHLTGASAWYESPLRFSDCTNDNVNYKAVEDGLYCPPGAIATCICQE